MKIDYEFINGERTEVEVGDEIGRFILDSRRIEENKERKERYHSYLLENATYEGNEYASKDTPESVLLEKFESKRIKNALESLSITQRRRLLMSAEGMSINKIARLEGIQPNAAWKSVKSAKKKFLKKFLKMGV